MENNNTNRRNFLKKSAITAGITAMGSYAIATNSITNKESADKLPREVWIASVSQANLSGDTSGELVKKILLMLGDVMVYQPDIICLPEAFVVSKVNQKYSMDEKIKVSLDAIAQFAEFSKKNNCYMICPVYTAENDKIYNAAVVIDRQGKRMGEYRKIYPTEGEIEEGITPGPLQPPVFKTDFGVIGIQICSDSFFDEGWRKLKEQGAEVVFWPSAFGGGKMLNARSWQNQYVVVTSTRAGITKICDVSGDEIAATGGWDKNWVCAPVNLEKSIVRIWPHVTRFMEIKKKYQRKIRITISHEEGWAVIESLSPEVILGDILKEFDLMTWQQTTSDMEKAQIKAR